MSRSITTDLGLQVDYVEGDWRHGVDPDEVAARLEAVSRFPGTVYLLLAKWRLQLN